MSATTTDQPAANIHDFDAELDAFVGATQRPTDAGMAGATPQDSEPQPATVGTATAPREGSAAPAASATGEPVAAQEGTPEAQAEEFDYRAAYEALQKKTTSEAAAELSAAGRLRKANEELAAIRAEAAREKARAERIEAQRNKDWDEAIDLAPEHPDESGRATKAQLRALREREQQDGQLAVREQRVTEHEEGQKQQAQALRRQAEDAARFYAIAELDTAIEARAKHEGLDPATFQPVRDWLNSPAMKALANRLPLISDHRLSGDPLRWQLDQIDNLDDLRTYMVAQAEAGYGHFRGQHAQAQARAEEERAAQNAQAAKQTYQPERAVGGAGGPQRKTWDELDIDEALDAFLTAPAR